MKLFQKLAPVWLLPMLFAVLASVGDAVHAQPGASAPLPSGSRQSDVPLQPAMKLALPDVTVLDQDGRQRLFFSDLVKGRTVAVNFIFTSCTSICTPLAATFKGVQDELARRGSKDIELISVSVDPLSDTPEELRKFGRKFGAGPNWTFVTGGRKSIDAILLAFGVGASTSDPSDHSPIVYLGNEPARNWTRAYGLAKPATIAQQLLDLRGAPTTGVPGLGVGVPAQGGPAPLAEVRHVAAAQADRASAVTASAASRGAAYFTNLPLQTQDRAVRFYDDLVRDRIVLIHSFYASCRDVCSPMGHNLARAQKLISENIEKPVQLISISTDPLADLPGVLREYASRHAAGPGWAFVTGKKENVDWVLHKLGLYPETKEAHTAVLWVGNDRTGRWLKLHAMAPPDAILDAVRKVL